MADRLPGDEVLHVAQLTHLSLTQEEIERLSTQLSAVLAHFESLQEVDTSEVEPTGHSTDVLSVMRDDEPAPSLPRHQVLEDAPQTEDDYIRVNPVLG